MNLVHLLLRSARWQPEREQCDQDRGDHKRTPRGRRRQRTNGFTQESDFGSLGGVPRCHQDAAQEIERQVHRDRRPQASGANAQDARRADLLLPGKADLRQNQMPGIAADFVIIQLHTNQYQLQPKGAGREIKPPAQPGTA